MTEKYPIGMVFGVFDGLHQGHQHLLTEAKKHCEKLIVVVAHPNTVLVLKQRLPHHDLPTRIQQICDTHGDCLVIAGDAEIGTWEVLKKHQPDIVLLGYDQERLGEEVGRLGIRRRTIEAHHPEKYKSSLLNKNCQTNPY